MIDVLPLNPMPDGTCRTVKSQYYKTGMINFLYQNVWGVTGGVIIYETR